MFTRLYLHIPFCRTKCPYCAFNSRAHADSDELLQYHGLLLREMELCAREAVASAGLDSLYLGGGTPSLLTPRQVTELIESAGRYFSLSPGAEVTLEANPGTVTLRSLQDFRQAGVNRLSLGVQSFDDRMLRSLGRSHTVQESLHAFDAARMAGFDNIGVDLIQALPGQSMDMWVADMEQAVRLGPEHLSVYGLTIEDDTPFAEKYSQACPLLPDEDSSAAMFEAADDRLRLQGYIHYEIANYARPGRESRHNRGYWHRDGYLGLGAGAHSCFHDRQFGWRCNNSDDPAAYAAAIGSGQLPRENISLLSRDEAMEEFMFLGLRLSAGISAAVFQEQFGARMSDVYGQVLNSLHQQGLLLQTTAGYALTRKGMLLSNRVFTQFLR